ncbi:MAG TPA: neutral zinc metallopeptidase [Acidimicrobiales bacterium]
MERSWRRGAALCLLAGLAATGCAREADHDPLSAGGGGIAPDEHGGPVPADDPNAVALQAVEDVARYWARTYPDVYGGDFEPLQGGAHPYGPDTPAPSCGPVEVSYEDIANNAFYCPEGDFVAWDSFSLIPEINEQFGAFTIGIVFAHEMGHAIQARAGVTGPTIELELQADCFAGAWTGDVAAGGSDAFTVDAVALDASLGGMVSISDAPGTAAEDPLAHGSGFDRIGAFQDGFENGPARCADYPNVELPVVEMPFREGQELDTGGNLPLDDSGSDPEGDGLLSLLDVDLNEFYGLLFGQIGHTFTPVDGLTQVDPAADEVTCGGETLGGGALEYAALYCADENVVVVDRPGLVEDLYTVSGDFAVAAEIARLWAQAAQDQLGVPAGDQADLQADCLTGVWALSSFETPEFQPSNLVMSPGDLDEGIIGFLYAGSGTDAGGNTAFERTDALRTGFLGGYDACERFAPLG